MTGALAPRERRLLRLGILVLDLRVALVACARDVRAARRRAARAAVLDSLGRSRTRRAPPPPPERADDDAARLVRRPRALGRVRLRRTLARPRRGRDAARRPTSELPADDRRRRQRASSRSRPTCASSARAPAAARSRSRRAAPRATSSSSRPATTTTRRRSTRPSPTMMGAPLPRRRPADDGRPGDGRADRRRARRVDGAQHGALRPAAGRARSSASPPSWRAPGAAEAVRRDRRSA